MTNDEILDIAEGIDGGHHFYAAVADELLIDFARAIIAQARAELITEMVPVAKVVSTVDADGDASLRAAWLGTPPERGVLLAVIPNKD
ncbi:hypothetical protein [Bordetella bronchialis]|uniref:Uncharacterized protein n=1 Tax=Bordetella bronchialis TaxID=463025 RepID=A0ABN4R654_9BORD|nr:hypothetical protein [Bordetella bronchialis]ANN66439.1 hypothetical protein BAU06_09160 [Bordetella bronchialis]